MDFFLFLLGILFILGLFPALLPSLETTYALGATIRDFVYHASDTVLTIILDWLYYTYRFLFNTAGHLLQMILYGARNYYEAWRLIKYQPQHLQKTRKLPRKKKAGSKAHKTTAKDAEIRGYISCFRYIHTELKHLRAHLATLDNGQKSIEVKLEDFRLITVSNGIEIKRIARRWRDVDSTTAGVEDVPTFKCSIFSTAPLPSRPQRLSAAHRRPLNGSNRHNDPAIRKSLGEEQYVSSKTNSQEDAPSEALVQQRENISGAISDSGLAKTSTNYAQQEVPPHHENEPPSVDTASFATERANEGQPEAPFQKLEEEQHHGDDNVSDCASLFEGSVGNLLDIPPPPSANNTPSTTVDSLPDSPLEPVRSLSPSSPAAIPAEQHLRLPKTSLADVQVEHCIDTTPSPGPENKVMFPLGGQNDLALDLQETDENELIDEEELEVSINAAQLKAKQKDKKMLVEIEQDPDMYGPIMRQFIQQQNKAQRTPSGVQSTEVEGEHSRSDLGVEPVKHSPRILKSCRRPRTAARKEKVEAEAEVAKGTPAKKGLTKEEHNSQNIDCSVQSSCTDRDAAGRSTESQPLSPSGEADDYDPNLHKEGAESPVTHTAARNEYDQTHTSLIDDQARCDGFSHSDTHSTQLPNSPNQFVDDYDPYVEADDRSRFLKDPYQFAGETDDNAENASLRGEVDMPEESVAALIAATRSDAPIDNGHQDREQLPKQKEDVLLGEISATLPGLGILQQERRADTTAVPAPTSPKPLTGANFNFADTPASAIFVQEPPAPRPQVERFPLQSGQHPSAVTLSSHNLSNSFIDSTAGDFNFSCPSSSTTINGLETSSIEGDPVGTNWTSDTAYFNATGALGGSDKTAAYTSSQINEDPNMVNIDPRLFENGGFGPIYEVDAFVHGEDTSIIYDGFDEKTEQYGTNLGNEYMGGIEETHARNLPAYNLQRDALYQANDDTLRHMQAEMDAADSEGRIYEKQGAEQHGQSDEFGSAARLRELEHETEFRYDGDQEYAEFAPEGGF